MSDAFILRSGGGEGSISEAFAVIAVNYPAGSICTCTNGSKTFRAKDTSGSYLFLIPSVGTWVVSCTNGTETRSQSVDITAQWQGESVELLYELRIVHDGISEVEWTTNAKSLQVLPSDADYCLKMTVTAANTGRRDFFASTPIDVTKYNTLYIKVTSTDQTGSKYRGCILNSEQYSRENAIVVFGETTSGTISIDTTIDISNVFGMQYLSFYRAIWVNTEWAQFNISSLYLR